MTTKEALLKELEAKLQSLNYCLPIDLKEINQVFELSNGCDAIRVNSTDLDYEIKRDLEEFSTEYENLTVSDLEEILSILDNVEVDNEKAFKRSQN